MVNSYCEFRKEQDETLNEFLQLKTIVAFSKESLNDRMREKGISEDDFVKEWVQVVGGTFMRKSDIPRLEEIARESDLELRRRILDDLNGDGFILDMFYYELSNHEYCITKDSSETLEILGISEDEIRENPKLKKGFLNAIRYALEDSEELRKDPELIERWVEMERENLETI